MDSTQEQQSLEGKPFTSYNLNAFRLRYMVRLVEVCSDCGCQQLNNDDELCLEETQRVCCICGAPTCLEHERRPAYQSCVIHAGQPRPGGGLCCVCIVCAELDRTLQEEVYHFRRKINEEGESVQHEYR